MRVWRIAYLGMQCGWSGGGGGRQRGPLSYLRRHSCGGEGGRAPLLEISSIVVAPVFPSKTEI